MEPIEIQRALESAVEQVLETMCFTSVVASSEGGDWSEGRFTPEIAAELQFEGDPRGGFRLGVSKKLARALGAGFLGLEEAEPSDSQAGDVVCELANMICGSTLSRLEDKATFRITHPELISQERGASCGGGGVNRWFDLGEGILTVSLELRQTV
jgi:CheY-specific phosphatase CheX